MLIRLFQLTTKGWATRWIVPHRLVPCLNNRISRRQLRRVEGPSGFGRRGALALEPNALRRQS